MNNCFIKRTLSSIFALQIGIVSTACGDSLLVSSNIGESSMLSVYDTAQLKTVREIKVDGEVLSISSAGTGAALTTLRRARKVSVWKFDLGSGRSQRVIDSSFQPLGVQTSDDGLIVAGSVASFDMPAIGLFDRFGSFQRVLARTRNVTTAPRFSPTTMRVLYTQISSKLPSVWSAPFENPTEATQISPDDCLDGIFKSDEQVILVCRGDNQTEFTISTKKLAPDIRVKILWHGTSLRAPVLSRRGDRAVIYGTHGDISLIELEGGHKTELMRQMTDHLPLIEFMQ